MKTLAAALLIGLAAVPPTASSAAGTPTSITIVSVPHLRAADLDDHGSGALRLCARAGACGWMNVRAARTSKGDDTSLAACYLTIGSGARATSPTWARHPITLMLPPLLEANAALDHAVHAGALGDACRRAGLRIRVRGGRALREAELLAMDGDGKVDESIDASVPAPEAPFGSRTNPETLATVGSDGWLSVLAYDDLLAAEAYAPLCRPEAARMHRQRALQRLNAWLNRAVLRSANLSRSPILLIAPTSRLPDAAKEPLAPIAVIGGGFAPGYLTSSSTRRTGLVAGVDVLPTICAMVGVSPPASSAGRPIRSVAHAESAWASSHRTWARVARAQRVMGGLPTVRLVLLLVVAATLLRAAPSCSVQRVGRIAAGLMIALPAVQMLTPVAQGLASRTATPFVLAGAAFGALSALSRPRFRGWVTVPASAFVCAVVVDLLLGATAQQVSWAGYSVFDGARYYGIGNEAAGAFLGALLVAGTPFQDPLGRKLHALAFLLVALLLVHPLGGANFGCGLASLLTSAALAPPPQSRLSKSTAAVGSILLAAVLVALVASDRGAGGSHLGHSLTSLGGIPAIAWRKMALNVHLLGASAWTPTLLCGTAVALVLHRRIEAPSHRRTVRAAGIAACALFLANDSGVLAAGEFLCVAVPGLTAYMVSRTHAPQPERVRDDAER